MKIAREDFEALMKGDKTKNRVERGSSKDQNDDA